MRLGHTTVLCSRARVRTQRSTTGRQLGLRSRHLDIPPRSVNVAEAEGNLSVAKDEWALRMAQLLATSSCHESRLEDIPGRLASDQEDAATNRGNRCASPQGVGGWGVLGIMPSLTKVQPHSGNHSAWFIDSTNRCINLKSASERISVW
jgi:hypothetical protein